MKQGLFTVKSNEKIATDVYKMVLCGDCSAITAPGQFVNLSLNGLFLRRPISVCDVVDGELILIFKVVGKGTEQMAGYICGKEVDILTGLGNGYDTSLSGERPLVIGGGVGVPPMYMLTKKLVDEGKKPIAILGFNKADEIFYADEFASLCETYVATADGSVGTRGFVTDVIKGLTDYTYTFSCGPLPMLKAVYNATDKDGQYSFEERMGCGFGACMGCSIKTNSGNKRVCKEGPIFVKEDIIW